MKNRTPRHLPFSSIDVYPRDDSLMFYLRIYLEEAMAFAADELVDWLTYYIHKNYYCKYSPTSYERTNDFLKSTSRTDTVAKTKNKFECVIFFDTDEIIPRIRDWGLNAHADFWGNDVSEHIPKWLDLGVNLIGRGHVELGSMEALFKYAEKQYPKLVAKHLRKMGLKIEVL